LRILKQALHVRDARHVGARLRHAGELALERGEGRFVDVADVNPGAVLRKRVRDGTPDAGGARGHHDPQPFGGILHSGPLRGAR